MPVQNLSKFRYEQILRLDAPGQLCGSENTGGQDGAEDAGGSIGDEHPVKTSTPAAMFASSR